MNTSVIEKIPVSALFPDRYGFGKTKVYAFLKELQIERVQEGKEAFILLEELQDLDEYVRLYRDGDRVGIDALVQRRRERIHERIHATREPFRESVQIESEPVRESVQAGMDGAIVQQVSQSPSWLMLVEAIAQRVQVQRPIDPLLPQQQLQQAMEHQWLLSTEQVKEIIGVKPHGQSFRRYGFTLVRSGRCGAQAAWAVEKASLEAIATDPPAAQKTDRS